jgi:hypothetical protein
LDESTVQGVSENEVLGNSDGNRIEIMEVIVPKKRSDSLHFWDGNIRPESGGVLPNDAVGARQQRAKSETTDRRSQRSHEDLQIGRSNFDRWNSAYNLSNIRQDNICKPRFISKKSKARTCLHPARCLI